ncbi:splicing factor 1 isoform X2 [Macrosteles quadrilineatus]|uniref:splicing factor 1 isoform X2 n=1 Tax=Macrosteles quadrilineatus TaxID=74068 RepID=UPI0023E28F0E|nr:splicing factor 1 isoform X2 [Macrosteles quadrilineatus]
MPSESSSSNKRESEAEREERRKRRKSRWNNDEKDKSFILGMPTVLPTNLSKEQEEAYLLQLQIEEVSRKLRTGDLGIPANPEERSPSPEPIYGSDGKRLNTREYRTRKRLEEERHALIQKMIKLNPDFKPPADYKPPIIRVSDKVMIPQDDHPDINFVGLLIGPRGNTLKSMERETGAKIIIRGKGSVKEGKVGRKDGQPLPGEDEPLHAYVTANNPECVKKAVDKIKEIIRQGVEVPEGQNDLRRMQLRELALLNGTLRENDGPRCTNCGSSEHKSWMCPDKPNVTNNIVCSLCGGAGHIAKDCRQKRPGDKITPPTRQDKAKIDQEYMSLMAELGEGPPPPATSSDSSPSSSSRFTSRPATGVLFDRRLTPKAIAAPPPTTQALPTPPQLIPNSLPPPPWSTQSTVAAAPPPQINLSQPPPPPWQTQTITVNVPPPTVLNVPPPAPTVSATLPWMSTAPLATPPPPTTVPPPSLPPWQQPPPTTQPPPAFWPQAQSYVVPPPQPVAPPPDLPNLLTAPPPPPPS